MGILTFIEHEEVIEKILFCSAGSHQHLNSSNKIATASTARGKDPMTKDLSAKLVISKKKIVHLYQGGVLSFKIKGKDGDASVEIGCGEVPAQQGTRIRFKTIDAE